MKTKYMTIIKKITFIIFSLSILGFAKAQKIDAKSQTILDAVSKKYKAKSNTYFKFIYGYGSGKISKTEPGIFYSQEDKYKLKIMGTEQIFDGSKIYNINVENHEVTIAKPNDKDVMFSPVSYLNSYSRDYKAKYLGKIKVNGVKAARIQLIPMKDNGLKYVFLFVDTSKNQLVKVEQFSKDNTISVIAISDYKDNLKLPANLFSFDKNQYKNYIVTEL